MSELVKRLVNVAQVFRGDPNADTAAFYLRQAAYVMSDTEWLARYTDNEHATKLQQSIKDFLDNPCVEVKHWVDTGNLLIQPDDPR